MPLDETQRLAVAMTVNCVRNTCLETFHAQGKLTDADMKAFNQQAASRIYTFIEMVFNRPKDEGQAFLNRMVALATPAMLTWNKPEFDKELWPDKGWPNLRTTKFTAKQGRYLAFIHQYVTIHGCSPAEADMQRFFNISPPSVHQMVLTLERKGLIQRTPGVGRSIRLLVPAGELPALK